MNSIQIIGRVTAPAEVRETAQGTKVANISLAVNRAKRGEVDFINCTAWDKTAELLERYVQKGDRIGFEGRLQQNRWQTKEGQNRSSFVVMINRVHFLTSKADREATPSDDYEGSGFGDMLAKQSDVITTREFDDSIPFG